MNFDADERLEPAQHEPADELGTAQLPDTPPWCY
jgi:hypothetical protein